MVLDTVLYKAGALQIGAGAGDTYMFAVWACDRENRAQLMAVTFDHF